ncbi:MAG: hypothetical protein Q9166_002446 [cf. Caloplaca sp. 2 TL-2023]
MFKRVVLMGHPFFGPPSLPVDVSPEEEEEAPQKNPQPDLDEELAKLPQPKEKYKWYYSTPSVSEEMPPPSGLRNSLRGYFHLKSADAHYDPKPIAAMPAQELDKLPHYYIMPLHLGMRATIAQDRTPEDSSNMRQKAHRWLPDSDLPVYVDEFSRNGFQGRLNWYRVSTNPDLQKNLDIFAGQRIEVPCLFMVGTKDWLLHQTPDNIDRMKKACPAASWTSHVGESRPLCAAGAT